MNEKIHAPTQKLTCPVTAIDLQVGGRAVDRGEAATAAALPCLLVTTATKSHDVPILVAARLLKPLGNPQKNGIKFFATAELLELSSKKLTTVTEPLVDSHISAVMPVPSLALMSAPSAKAACIAIRLVTGSSIFVASSKC